MPVFHVSQVACFHGPLLMRQSVSSSPRMDGSSGRLDRRRSADPWRLPCPDEHPSRTKKGALGLSASLLAWCGCRLCSVGVWWWVLLLLLLLLAPAPAAPSALQQQRCGCGLVLF